MLSFQVENYNEKYSVVSGCPKKNGIRHVRNIAMLSLKLMAKMCDFKIRHKPFMTLRLRICCHCGEFLTKCFQVETSSPEIISVCNLRES